MQYSYFNFYIIQKNYSNISEVIFGIKSKNNYNKEKYVNLSIRIDDNLFYHIYSSERENIKIYLENLNCNKDIFIIEDYLQIDNSNLKSLIIDKLYGNYSLYNFISITDLNFENYEINNKTDISDYILPLSGFLNIYILKCVTPSAFHFEIFTEFEAPKYIYLGQSIKTFFTPSEYYYGYIHLGYLNESHKYKVKVRIMDYIPNINRTLYCLFHNQNYDYKVEINEPYNVYNEIYYADYTDYWFPHFGIKTNYDIYVEYYFTSNQLFKNIAEGRIKIDTFPSNSALKIRKDIFFDYIFVEVKSEEEIVGLFELKLINNRDIEEESNTLMVGLPNVWMPYSNNFNLTFSNPYSKFDQIADINNLDNYFYLLFTFYTKNSIPVYINIEYINNEQIIDLSPKKSKIILPQTEYEIISYNENYEIKDKVLFNINKCNNLVNYTFINYYENINNIIKETLIVDSHQEILIDNIYYKSKIVFYEESELKSDKINDSFIYPASYFNKGDISLNYFLIESSILKELKFTRDFNINYENETDIKISWKKYVYRESNGNKINIPTNYSIYILPKNSIVNTMCQLFLIPSNKSIINKTEIKIDLNEGQYKIAIIASVIDTEMPFEIMYNILELNVIKKSNITSILFLIFFGIIIILLVLILIFRKKLMSLCGRKKLFNDLNNLNNANHSMIDYSEEEDNEDEEYEKNKLTDDLMKFMKKK